MTTAYANNEVVSDDENDTACECGHCGRNQTAPQYTTDAIISASEAIALLRDADAIIIGAGAGASIDAGINYADKAKFKRLYPGLVERGVAENFWEMIGYHGDVATSWAYLAQHALEMTRHQPHPTYAALRRAVGDKPHFILTSNVDGHFLHHFDREALLTAQGDFAKLQCGSCRTVWPAAPQLERIAAAVDAATCTVDEALVPRCASCGRVAQPHVNGGEWFVHEAHADEWKRLEAFLAAHRDRRVVAIDIGSGFNTPGVVRMRLERFVDNLPRATLLRLNAQQPHVPLKLARERKAFSLPISFAEFASQVPN